MIVILAVDALEYELVGEFGLENLELNAFRKLGIPEGMYIHTRVIWPTIVTGERPETHGIDRGHVSEWKSPILRRASESLGSLLPTGFASSVGDLLESAGFEHSSMDDDYYSRQDLSTIFDGVRSKAVDVPEYSESGVSDDIKDSLDRSFESLEEAEELISKCEAEFEEKTGVLKSSLNLPTEVLMVYFYSLDGLQHVFYDNADFIEGWYEKFDGLVEDLLDELGEDDTLILVSDHGMEGGEHTSYAYLSSTDPDFVRNTESILDFKPNLNVLLESKRDSNEGVKQNLKDLGYF